MRCGISAFLRRFSLSSSPPSLQPHHPLQVTLTRHPLPPTHAFPAPIRTPLFRPWPPPPRSAASPLASRFQTLSSPFSRSPIFKPWNRSYFTYRAPPPDVVLWSIIGANVFVHLLWQVMDVPFMRKHFMVSIDSILSGHLYTLLTAGFSQRDAYHLLSNMIGLYFFGSEIGMHFGGRYLFVLYLAGCVGGSLGHLAYYTYVYPWIQNIPRKFYNYRYTPAALGASGAITAITIFDILLSPKRTIYFQLLFPMPAALVGVFIIGNDIWHAKQGSSEISSAGHLGGAVVGLLAWIKLMLPWWRY